MYNCHRELRHLFKLLGIEIEVKSVLDLSLFEKSDILNEKVGKILVPEEDGFLCELNKNTPIDFAIVIKMIPCQHIVPAVVQGREEKKINLLGNKTPNPSLVASYVTRVRTEKIPKVGISTKYVNNNLRIFVFADRWFYQWEVAIVTRITALSSRYFLTLQKVYTSEMYNDGGQVWMPPDQFEGYETWDSLQKLTALKVASDRLPDRELYAPEKEPGKENFAPGDGRVIFFNLANGHGFVRTKMPKDPAIHWSQIKDGQRFAHLEKDQLIKYEDLEFSLDDLDRCQLVGVTSVTSVN